MSTRHKKENGPLSQNRYMSSPEYAELNGINGVAVATRAAILLNAAKQELLWFFQALSLKEGGLRRVAKELIELFPEHLGTPEMHKANVRPGKNFPGELMGNFALNVLGNAFYFNEGEKPHSLKGEVLLDHCKEVALSRNRIVSERRRERDFSIEEFLIDLCINPRMNFSLPGEKVDVSNIETDLAIEANPELEKYHFTSAKLSYFHDITGALAKYKNSTKQKSANRFN